MYSTIKFEFGASPLKTIYPFVPPHVVGFPPTSPEIAGV